MLPGCCSHHIRNESVTFLDGTPDYLHIPAAACRIAAAFPDARFIVLLKDPVQRALSHHSMIMHGERYVDPDFATEARLELEMLRSKRCSYEPEGGAATFRRGLVEAGSRRAGAVRRVARQKTAPRSRSGSSSSSGGGGSSSRSGGLPLSRWIPRTGVPNWNSCFRCVFMACGTYAGPAVLKAGKAAGWFNKTARCSFEDRRAGVLRKGLYAYQLEWWLRFFRPEQFLVINYRRVGR